ncbi:hypothetical protein X768_23280 [Mesorhizobium sp. LSJC265A00]|uniref:hypothetical protein n=1 Tax=Mesorhizobium sp. LSJC265A00 TaxID=1287322 RepID=UPI0003CE957C|nr:hypothetical protein [Mesorhizobium sp. LSJC265A00]ESX08393.1 hypothetical protein X768_23280 [Mesorhizobium sp. LSJC265A00]
MAGYILRRLVSTVAVRADGRDLRFPASQAVAGDPAAIIVASAMAVMIAVIRWLPAQGYTDCEGLGLGGT